MKRKDDVSVSIAIAQVGEQYDFYIFDSQVVTYPFSRDLAVGIELQSFSAIDPASMTFLLNWVSSRSSKGMSTRYRIALAQARKPYPVGFLFTYENGEFGAISVTERSCPSPISKVDRPCHTSWHCEQVPIPWPSRSIFHVQICGLVWMTLKQAPETPYNT